MAIPMLARLQDWSARAPADIAACEGDAAWTITTLLASAARTARWLRDSGVIAGDRVVWHGHSSLDFASVLLATWMLDATYVGINPRYTAREIEDVLARTSPRLVLTAAWLRDRASRPDSTHAAWQPRGDQPAALVFTTGSTGRPKIAILTHSGIAAASASQAAQMRSEARRTINALPANHIGGLVNITTATWWAHETVDFVPVFSPEAIAARLHASDRVRLAAVPTLFRRCLDADGFADAARGRLVHALSGGAPLPRTVHDDLRALGARVQGMYGQSEVSGSVCFTAAGDDGATTCETVGRATPGVELRCGPLDGTPGALPAGELQVRGTQVFSGYLDDADATRAAFTADGWLRTGDLARFRDDGAVTLTGRLKEIINTGGHKVMPAEVEQVLQAHPAVAAVAVVGTADPMFGEAVAAAVVWRAGHAHSVEALAQWSRDMLANYKVPKRWLTLDTLPLLGVGKVDRRRVAALFSDATHD
jgi:acyl-CoA synthetase (AMP-forming)/AMP-acid ligase II